MLGLNYVHNLCHINLQISYLSHFYETDKIRFEFRIKEMKRTEIN
jgi:hypothetical protein